MNKEIDKQGKPSFVSGGNLPGWLLSGWVSQVSKGVVGDRELQSSSVSQQQQDSQAPGSGMTGIPFTRNWVLDTMTLSPTFNPEETE